MSTRDGSVLNGNSDRDSGTWAMEPPGGPIVTGQLNIHKSDVTAIWCEEHLHTDNDRLSDQRTALAVIDAACGAVHAQCLSMSYAGWIVFEKFMLLDEEPLLIFGTVANYLNDRHYKDGHRKWLRRQRLHDETYHTMAEDELEMRSAGNGPLRYVGSTGEQK
ncbi:hypothetical protein PHMEG_00028824 [Phytophthora megakarya]|uniref:Uncharacterized protein n=1 Tax=Phytophthora megakarya TaxID=4795 RepID=A0A225V5N3_9STRA|nr:hypothetical protein PHMEG_00028824 [Phytophthora megakarya]